MSRTINLRKQIIDALLSNDEVCAALIAKEIGCAPESAGYVLRELSPYLAKRPAPNEPGKNRIYYSAVDRELLGQLRDKKRRVATTIQMAARQFNFEGLLRAWGIDVPRGCTLPSLVHRLESESEELLSKLFGEAA